MALLDQTSHKLPKRLKYFRENGLISEDEYKKTCDAFSDYYKYYEKYLEVMNRIDSLVEESLLPLSNWSK